MFHMEQNKSPPLLFVAGGSYFLLRNCSFYDKVENV